MSTPAKIHEKKIKNQDLVKTIQKVAKENLISDIQDKAKEVSEYLENSIKKIEDNNGLTSTKIYEIITNRSTSDIATIGNKSFTPQELAIAFNIYVKMMAKINKYVKMPPSKNTFCLLLGISTVTYNNYLQDQDRSEIMNIIETYITGANINSAQIGEIKEISTMFELKAQHGFVEASAPIVFKHEGKVDIDDIKSQLNEIKKGRLLEADYEEKEDSKSFKEI